MAVWTAPETTASDRVAQAHRSRTGNAPAHTADAPGTLIVVGENSDHFGGITIVGLTDLRAAAAVSPREDSTIAVYAEFAGITVEETTDCARIAQLAEHNEPADENPARTLAERFGGLVHTLVGRQMLSRDTAGMDITVIADIPLGAGLGALHAADAALVLALMGGDEEIDAAPLRTRLADIASQSARTFSHLPVLRARHSAALRGKEDTVSVIDYADGSLTQAPHPAKAEVRIVSVAPSHGESFVDKAQAVQEGREFIDDACANFGVASLRQLPNAADRVVEWVDARRQVHGTDSAPTLETARAWVDFGAAETELSANAARALRSMRTDEFFEVIGAPEQTPGLPAPDQLVQLLALRGARAARPAAAGMSAAALAYIPSATADNAIADLSADGLAVVEVTPGAPARVTS
ncbi:galactokinase [Corynebacterium sp. 20_84]